MLPSYSTRLTVAPCLALPGESVLNMNCWWWTQRPPLRKQNSAMTHLCNSWKVSKVTYLSQPTNLFTNLIPVVPGMEKAMAPHSSTLAWKVPWTEEPGSLQSMGSLCLHPQGCLRRDVRASGSYLEWTGNSGSFNMWHQPWGYFSNFLMRLASSGGLRGTSGTPCISPFYYLHLLTIRLFWILRHESIQVCRIWWFLYCHIVR